MAAKILEYKDTIDKALNDSKKPWTYWLALAEEKTRIKRIYLFLGEIYALKYLIGSIVQLISKNITLNWFIRGFKLTKVIHDINLQ